MFHLKCFYKVWYYFRLGILEREKYDPKKLMGLCNFINWVVCGCTMVVNWE